MTKIFDHVFHPFCPPKKAPIICLLQFGMMQSGDLNPIIDCCHGGKTVASWTVARWQNERPPHRGFFHFDSGLGMWELIMQTTKQQTVRKLHMVGLTPVAWWWPKSQGISESSQRYWSVNDHQCYWLMEHETTRGHWVFRASPTYLCGFFLMA